MCHPLYVPYIFFQLEIPDDYYIIDSCKLEENVVHVDTAILLLEKLRLATGTHHGISTQTAFSGALPYSRLCLLQSNSHLVW